LWDTTTARLSPPQDGPALMSKNRDRLIGMSELSHKSEWVDQLDVGEPAKTVLGRLVDLDHDEFEEQLYDTAADPQSVLVEQQRRRYREMFRRRMRHRAAANRS
jgi:hypothetical protein